MRHSFWYARQPRVRSSVAASLPISTTLQRMVDAVEQVRQRLLKACAALRAGGVDYAVAGGNAVAAWVATVDEAAVRNTQDVDIMIRRSDLDAAKRALESAGFVHRQVAGVDLFLDHAAASPDRPSAWSSRMNSSARTSLPPTPRSTEPSISPTFA